MINSWKYIKTIEKHYKNGDQIIAVVSKADADKDTGITSNVKMLDLTDSYNMYDKILGTISRIIEDCTDPKRMLKRISNTSHKSITLQMTSRIFAISLTIRIKAGTNKNIPGLKEAIDLFDELYENNESTIAVEYNNKILEIPGNQ